MDLSGELFGLGVVGGYRDRMKERKAEDEHDEDRAFTLEQRQRTRQQWGEQDKAAKVGAEKSQLDLGSLRDKVEREGAYDFLNDVHAGVNPLMAAARYNQRGVHKIDPNSVKWDPATRNISFSSVDDVDGDGKPDVTQGSIDKMMANAETLLGKQKDRYMNVPDGGSVFDKEKNQFVANNPKDASSRAAGSKVVEADKAIIGPDGKELWRGPQYGKTGGAGDRKISPFNPEGYAKDAQGEFARLVGGKYDPTTMQFDYGGASVKMVPFAQSMQEDVANLNSTAPGKVPPQFIASVYADAANQFDEDAIRAQVRTKANDDVGFVGENDREQAGLFGGLGKPKASVVKQRENNAVNEARAQLIRKARTAISYESARGNAADAVSNPSGDSAPAERTPAAAPPTSAPPAQSPVQGGAVPPIAAFGRGLPGTRVTFKNGQVWQVGQDGKPARVK